MCDKEKIQQIINNGENLNVEFKSDKNQISDKEIFEEVVAFANTHGGYLFIGVEDNGAIIGAKSRHGNSTNCRKLKTAIFNNTVPGIETKIVVLSFEKGEILLIEIPASELTCATAQGKVLRRKIGGDGKPATVPFFPHEQLSKKTDTGILDYSSLVLDDTSFDDLNPLEFERLKQILVGFKGDESLLELTNFEIAKALRLVESRSSELKPNIAGLLLLGHEESIRALLPTHRIFFQVLDSQGNVKVNDSFEGPLLKTLLEIQNRFEARNDEREVQDGLFRIPIPDYSPEGFREAFINAVLHRDYSKLESIYLQWHEDHILISNPGGFPEGITINNFLVHEPKPRNPRLADAFKRIGLAEQTARGLDKIYLGQLRYGRAIPDYSRSDSDGVRVILKGGKASLRFAALVYEFDSTGAPLGLDAMLVINTIFTDRRINSQQAGVLIQKGPIEGKALLERLHENGILEARGQQRKRNYHLSASIYKKLNMESEYIRAKGFEPFQQEQMVIDYIKKLGRISRSETTELCKIGSDEAKRLLRKLLNKHPELKMKGKKRGIYYIWESQ